MPVQNYGAIMQGAADLTAMPANAFAQGQQRKQAQEYRNSLLGMDQQRLAMDQQQYGDKMAQADEDDAEWDDAFAKKDWARMARVDPQTTKILWDQEEAQKPKAPEYKAVGDSLLEMPTAPGQDPRVAFTAPRRYEPTADERDWARYQSMTPEQRALHDRYKGRNSEDEFARYQAMSPEQRTLYDRYKGRNANGGGVTVGPDGQLMVSPDPSKATEGERTASNYADRMQSAEKKLGSYSPSVKDYAASAVVMAKGPMVASAANKVVSRDGQLFYQAASDWVRAKLRKESGASIPPDEMAQEIKTYFPLPGDSSEVIAQKAAAREQATAGMRQMAGRASSTLSQPSKTSAPSQNRRVVKFEDL
jgi:hypothetical protein